RIKGRKNTLRWDKTSCHRFEANQARLKMGALAYNLLHMLRRFCVRGEGVMRSVEWLIRRLIKIGAGSPFTPGSGTFTWPRPSRWLITAGLCSAMADEGSRGC
ncbi:MAG: transposase, partial [Nitrospinota bacterium]|nr:transposase [Nitrospinota bacterium]